MAGLDRVALERIGDVSVPRVCKLSRSIDICLALNSFVSATMTSSLLTSSVASSKCLLYKSPMRLRPVRKR